MAVVESVSSGGIIFIIVESRLLPSLKERSHPQSRTSIITDGSVF